MSSVMFDNRRSFVFAYTRRFINSYLTARRPKKVAPKFIVTETIHASKYNKHRNIFRQNCTSSEIRTTQMCRVIMLV